VLLLRHPLYVFGFYREAVFVLFDVGLIGFYFVSVTDYLGMGVLILLMSIILF